MSGTLDSSNLTRAHHERVNLRSRQILCWLMLKKDKLNEDAVEIYDIDEIKKNNGDSCPLPHDLA